MSICKKHMELKLAYFSRNSIPSCRKYILLINLTRGKIEEKTVVLFFHLYSNPICLNYVIVVPDLLTFNKPLYIHRCVFMFKCTHEHLPKIICLCMYVCTYVLRSVYTCTWLHILENSFMFLCLYTHICTNIFAAC